MSTDSPLQAPRPIAGESSAILSELGRYTPLLSLGSGGMADVLLALAQGPGDFDKLVVIKRLKPELAANPGFRAMFLSEGRLAARLNHPNVVATYEVGEFEGQNFIVMEYLEGLPLNRIMRAYEGRGERLPQDIALRIVCDTLAGLGYAHSLEDYDGSPLHIVHRDVSPHNLFVTYDGQVKILDFGIAKAQLAGRAETDAGTRKGKISYMAPEQYEVGELDARADLFAVGIILWELLTGRSLMRGEHDAVTVRRLLVDDIPSMRSVLATLAESLDRVCCKSLERDRNARYGSAAEMRHALEEAAVFAAGMCTNAELAVFMASSFEAARREIRRLVREHMTSRSDRKLRAHVEHAMEGTPSRSGAGTAITRMEGTRSQPRRAVVLLALGLGAAGIAGLGMLRGRETRELEAGARANAGAQANAASPSASSDGDANAAEASAPLAASAEVDAQIASHEVPAIVSEAKAPAAIDPAASDAAKRDTSAYLSIDTYPWSRVTIDGHPAGETPLVAVPVKPGTHTLVFENPETHHIETRTITLKPNERLNKRFAFE